MNNLQAMAQDIVAAERKLEVLQRKRPEIVADLLEAEDQQNEKRGSKAREVLSRHDADMQLAGENVRRLTRKIEDAARAGIQARAKDLTSMKAQLDAERQQALETIAHLCGRAQGLLEVYFPGFGQPIEVNFRRGPYEGMGDPERQELIDSMQPSFERERAGIVASLDDYRQRLAEARELEDISDPKSLDRQVHKLWAVALRDARQEG